MMYFSRKKLTKATRTQTLMTGVTWDSSGHHSVTTVPLQMSPLVWVQGGWRPVQGAVIRGTRQWTSESFVFTLAKKKMALHEKVGRKRKGNYIPQQVVHTTLHDMSTVVIDLQLILLLLRSATRKFNRTDENRYQRFYKGTVTMNMLRDVRLKKNHKREDEAVNQWKTAGSQCYCSILN